MILDDDSCVILFPTAEFFVDGLGSLHVGSCDDIIINHASKIKALLPWGQTETDKAYSQFRHNRTSDIQHALYYFKNRFKCITGNWRLGQSVTVKWPRGNITGEKLNWRVSAVNIVLQPFGNANIVQLYTVWFWTFFFFKFIQNIFIRLLEVFNMFTVNRKCFDSNKWSLMQIIIKKV